MRFKHSRGWTPYDVSRDGDRYEVRSEGPNGQRCYIEVNARTQAGARVVTAPELGKVRRLGERAWPDLVTSRKGERPLLRITQDPTPKLSPEVLHRQLQCLVQEKHWLCSSRKLTE